jgi:hypothetical protein
MRIIYALCIILLSSLHAYAEDAKPAAKSAEDEQSTEPTSDDANKQATKADAATSTIKKVKQNDDIFRPSEEISEDFAVSFPVDI